MIETNAVVKIKLYFFTCIIFQPSYESNPSRTEQQSFPQQSKLPHQDTFYRSSYFEKAAGVDAGIGLRTIYYLTILGKSQVTTV